MGILKSFKHKRWYKNLPDDKKTFYDMYKDISGFKLSKAARTEDNEDDITLTYGEIDYDTFTDLLKLTKPKSTDVFYDLGSGVGKAVLCAALQFSLKKAVGIECLEPLHAAAKECLKLYSGETPIAFKQGDLFSDDWSEADIAFINATCFFGNDWDNIAKLCKQLKPGSRLIITSKSLPESDFDSLSREDHHMSWGFATVTIYVRK